MTVPPMSKMLKVIKRRRSNTAAANFQSFLQSTYTVGLGCLSAVSVIVSFGWKTPDGVHSCRPSREKSSASLQSALEDDEGADDVLDGTLTRKHRANPQTSRFI